MDAVVDARLALAHDRLDVPQAFERQAVRSVDSGHAQHDPAHAPLGAPDSRHFLGADAAARTIRARLHGAAFVHGSAGGVAVHAGRAHVDESVRRHGRQLQEPVEAQVALAEHRRRREVDDGLLVEPLRDRHARTDAIEVDRERADTEAPQLRDALRASAPGS